MFSLRRVLVILISLALPLNGWASIVVPSLCPMQAVSASVHAEMAGMKGPCCTEHGKGHKQTSNPCKSGQECQTGALYFASAPLQTASLPPTSSPVNLPITQLAARAPAVVWRPPLIL
jgi:hypothetical protein